MLSMTLTPVALARSLPQARARGKSNIELGWEKGDSMELEGVVRRAYSRRAFLLGAVSATTAGVLAACSQPSATPTSAPAAAPTAAATKPAAAASPAASPAAAASPDRKNTRL